ncbi:MULTISPECIES: ParB/RepB/Spo0J family partition protein [Ferrimonas]|uniref:ParB/RepB/Spo0J family partition protein n=1 Tax=Ferrimonas TaxID=44011 RepID=UPI00048409BA|nr:MULTISPECIES: ParB/RepB/Spo0J family partition protein [Ferrimonas]USD37624.1 ParB/RepB/Spo0J family partition protein [Ferrimonas sp. SCSIO 43195]
MSAKKRGLGKGLDALLGTSKSVMDRREQIASAPEPSPAPAPEVAVPADSQDGLVHLRLELLQRGEYQPRRDMSTEALEELADSIRSQGILQPIVVRPLQPGQYEILAGERRWRASQMAGLETVPCIVKNVADEAAVAIALIENIQRENLNAMEEAIALQRLADEFEMTHADVAKAVGKSRATVTNLLRLNNLNDEVKTLLEHGDLEMGHARALLGLDGDAQTLSARVVVAKGLTVRDTEKLVANQLQPKPEKPAKVEDPDVTRLINQLTERLGAQVAIQQGSKGKGRLVINYDSLDQLDGIISRVITD